ncbi:hypothetical protein [Spirosoma validum]|uniref:Uncharacterized protein n=1 Tax=Spirosoma validum TaxID=2771355 RepID=A0A927GDG9_9BACT|nr:hypothetical protein [Spirosoma validum]MBD2753787.1 hypothetical protein [Spirosoma validum]
MGLKARFNPKALVRERMKRAAVEIEALMIRQLQYAGEELVGHARTNDTYRDQTGNLRNSIGYIILKRGRIIKSEFSRSAAVRTKSENGRVRTTKGSQDGVTTGREFAKKIAAEYPGYLTLVVVAGMNYAGHVEAMGLDVLSSAENLAKIIVPRLMQQLSQQVANVR